MFVPLMPTQQDRNSSGLHDSIIKLYNFIQTCSKLISEMDQHPVNTLSSHKNKVYKVTICFKLSQNNHLFELYQVTLSFTLNGFGCI